MPIPPWTPFGPPLNRQGWVSSPLSLYLYRPAAAATRGYAWAVWKGGGETALVAHGHTRADLRAYCERERITLPELPGEWCPEPVEEPAKPYSLADDPRLREVVRTKWGEARWYEGNGNDGMHLAVDHEEGFCLASVYPDGRWIAYSGPTSADEIQRASKATNPANAYDECMAALRDPGSLVVDEPDADGWIPWGGGECPVPAGTVVEYRLHDGGIYTDDAVDLGWDHCDCADIIAYRIISSPEPTEKPEPDTGAVQMQTTRDRLLNLADRMFYSDRSATFYAGELRDLARELDGGAK